MSAHFCYIDICLPDILSLPANCRGHNSVPMLATDEVCGTENRSGPVRPRHRFPGFLRADRALDRVGDDGTISL